MFSSKQIESNIANYISCLFESTDEKIFYSALVENSSAYIFGGFIRDYFLFEQNQKSRDIDIVVSVISNRLRELIELHCIKVNQFGGYKLAVGDKTIDIWELDKTWYFKENHCINFDLVNVLPATVFFNVTAVLFSLDQKKLIYHDSFERSIKSKMLDIVNSNNPLPELCIVKSYEYINKFNLKISKSLKEYIKKYYSIKRNKIINIQLSHYGDILFQIDELDEFYNKILHNDGIRQSMKFDKDQLSLFSTQQSFV